MSYNVVCKVLRGSQGEIEQKVNDAIKQILRGEVGEFVAQKTDGGIRAREAATIRYVNEVLRDAYQKLLKNRRAD